MVFLWFTEKSYIYEKEKKMILNTYIPMLAAIHCLKSHICIRGIFTLLIYALEWNENIVTVPSSDRHKIKWKYENEKVIPSPLPTKIANFVFVFEISQSCKIFKIPVEFLHM